MTSAIRAIEGDAKARGSHCLRLSGSAGTLMVPEENHAGDSLSRRAEPR
jgi:hypothetical protein